MDASIDVIIDTEPALVITGKRPVSEHRTKLDAVETLRNKREKSLYCVRRYDVVTKGYTRHLYGIFRRDQVPNEY